MDRIKKALLKLSAKDRKTVFFLLNKIKNRDFSNLDKKKLRGFSNIFRVRKGDIRIIYIITNDGLVKLLSVSLRSKKTYEKF